MPEGREEAPLLVDPSGVLPPASDNALEVGGLRRLSQIKGRNLVLLAVLVVLVIAVVDQLSPRRASLTVQSSYEDSVDLIGLETPKSEHGEAPTLQPDQRRAAAAPVEPRDFPEPSLAQGPGHMKAERTPESVTPVPEQRRAAAAPVEPKAPQAERTPESVTPIPEQRRAAAAPVEPKAPEAERTPESVTPIPEQRQAAAAPVEPKALQAERTQESVTPIPEQRRAAEAPVEPKAPPFEAGERRKESLFARIQRSEALMGLKPERRAAASTTPAAHEKPLVTTVARAATSIDGVVIDPRTPESVEHIPLVTTVAPPATSIDAAVIDPRTSESVKHIPLVTTVAPPATSIDDAAVTDPRTSESVKHIPLVTAVDNFTVPLVTTMSAVRFAEMPFCHGVVHQCPHGWREKELGGYHCVGHNGCRAASDGPFPESDCEKQCKVGKAAEADSSTTPQMAVIWSGGCSSGTIPCGGLCLPGHHTAQCCVGPTGSGILCNGEDECCDGICMAKGTGCADPCGPGLVKCGKLCLPGTDDSVCCEGWGGYGILCGHGAKCCDGICGAPDAKCWAPFDTNPSVPIAR